MILLLESFSVTQEAMVEGYLLLWTGFLVV